MRTLEATAAAVNPPAVHVAAESNMFARTLQGIRNLVSAWWQPTRPMFDFTDDYFDEFPVTRRQPSYDGWRGHALRELPDLTEVFADHASRYEKASGPWKVNELSAFSVAMLALAWPGMGSAPAAISNQLSILPSGIDAGGCRMLCIPGAKAEVLRQRRVSWALLHQRFSAPMGKPGPVKVNILPTARTLPSAPGTPTFLADAESWNDDVVIRLALDQLKAFMGALPSSEWQTYLKLRADMGNLTAEVTSDFQARAKAWEDSCVDEINRAINAEIGPQANGPLDCRNAWLHTDYQTTHSRSRRALAEGELVQKRRSVRLWDAARQGFSYAVAWKFGAGRNFATASFVSTDRAGDSPVWALDVSRLANIVRSVDPGAKLGELADQLLEPESKAARRLFDLHIKTLQFDIMDAARTPATTGVDAAVRVRLLAAISLAQGNNDWRRYRAEFGITVPALGVGRWVQLPFFVYQVEGVGVVAHAMGRPGGPLRVFSDLAQAEAWLTAAVDLTEPWLQAQLSGDDRERAVELIKAMAESGVPLPDLNPVAALLRDTLSRLLPTPAVTIEVDSRLVRRLPMTGGSPQAVPWTLASPGLEFGQSRIRANAARLATPSGALDWAYAAQAGLETVSEILDLLLTPVPGGLRGLNRVRTMAFGGYIGLNLAVGIFDASHGDGTRMTGAALDIVDLAFGLYSARAAAEARIRQAGYRRISLLSNGADTDGLWRFDAEAMIHPRASIVDGQLPSNDGIIHVLGQSFIQLEQPTGTTVVLAANRGGDGIWRLRPHDASNYAPPIKRSGSHWVLDLDDASDVKDTGLLSRSLSMAGMRATRDTVTRLQDVTGVTRTELDRIWNGEAPPSWFDGAATRVAIGDILNRMLSTYQTHHEPVHAIGEAYYVQFLADMLGERVRVIDDSGVTAYLLNPRTGTTRDSGQFDLYRQHGGSYGATPNAVRGERVGIPGILDVALAERPTLGASHETPAAETSLQARRELVNEASDAWVRRHAREIARSCLRAFDLEPPRPFDDFLAAGKVAAGRRLPSPDKSTDALLAQLQYRYPGLTRADAIAVLADQTLGPLARGEPDADLLADALTDLGVFSRVTAARFRALSGQYDADSEALLLSGLTAHAAWPADRSIEVVQGGVDPQTGDVISHGLSVARYGRGSKSMMLVRMPDGSHRMVEIPGRSLVIPQTRPAHAVPLIDQVIQALPEADRQRFHALTSIDAQSIVASMDIQTTSQVLLKAADQQVRATSPLPGNYVVPYGSIFFSGDPVNGYYKAVRFGQEQHFIQIDGLMVRAIPDARDRARARLLPEQTHTYPDPEDAPIVRRDRRGHWRLGRMEGAAQRDLAAWESPGSGFSHPTKLLMPIDGIESAVVTGGTWRFLAGRQRVRVVFDFDFQAWRSIDDPARVFRRVKGQWHEGSVTGAVDTPTQMASIDVPSIPLPPVDAQPLPKTIGYGWTGMKPPSERWLARVRENARLAAEGNSGWSSRLHVDLHDAAKVQKLSTALKQDNVQVLDLRRDPAFLDWLRTPAGMLYTAAREGAYPCNASAMDVLRFGWILKRHGGVYLDMDDVILNDWANVGELRAGPFQLLSGGPVNQALLGLDWDINTSHLGSHAGNPLLDRVVATMVERATLKPRFFNEPRRVSAEDYALELSHLTGPGVLKDVLEQHAPEVADLIAAMRLLDKNDIRYEALELAVIEARESYFPFAHRIEPGHENSWVPSDE